MRYMRYIAQRLFLFEKVLNLCYFRIRDIRRFICGNMLKFWINMHNLHTIYHDND